MPNMDYCKFENTVGDMEQCIESEDMGNPSDLSKDEKQAREKFIELCVQIALDYGDEIGQAVVLDD